MCLKFYRGEGYTCCFPQRMVWSGRLEYGSCRNRIFWHLQMFHKYLEERSWRFRMCNVESKWTLATKNAKSAMASSSHSKSQQLSPIVWVHGYYCNTCTMKRHWWRTRQRCWLHWLWAYFSFQYSSLELLLQVMCARLSALQAKDWDDYDTWNDSQSIPGPRFVNQTFMSYIYN